MDMAKKSNKYLYWIPRILAVIYILFLMMFSLDVFELGLGFWETALGLFMHNIPALILVAVLIISWKYEIVGGIAFVAGGLFYIYVLLTSPQLGWHMLPAAMIISGPAFLIGFLFLIGSSKREK